MNKNNKKTFFFFSYIYIYLLISKISFNYIYKFLNNLNLLSETKINYWFKHSLNCNISAILVAIIKLINISKEKQIGVLSVSLYNKYRK